MWITKNYSEGQSATFWIDVPDTTENRKRIEIIIGDKIK